MDYFWIGIGVAIVGILILALVVATVILFVKQSRLSDSVGNLWGNLDKRESALYQSISGVSQEVKEESKSAKSYVDARIDKLRSEVFKD